MGKALLLVTSVALALGVLEVAARAFVPIHFGTDAAYRFVLDPELIYRLRPSTVASWRTAEFVETTRTNALGLRGSEVLPKRPGERRILAIGDSFTYGHGVGDDETYPAVLATLLRAAHGDVTVVNAGVPGYSTDQAYAYFVRHGAALDADLVIAGIHCSDISDNWEAPLYDLTGDGTLVARDARDSRMYRMGAMLGDLPALLQRSRLFDVVIASVEWQDGASARPAVADLSAWSRRKIVAEMRDVAARGAARSTRTAVVLMPCKKALADPDADGFGSLAADLAAAGIPVLDATPAIRRTHGDLAPLFFRADVHLNAAGNRALATAVADYVTAHGLL